MPGIQLVNASTVLSEARQSARVSTDVTLGALESLGLKYYVALMGKGPAYLVEEAEANALRLHAHGPIKRHKGTPVTDDTPLPLVLLDDEPAAPQAPPTEPPLQYVLREEFDKLVADVRELERLVLEAPPIEPPMQEIAKPLPPMAVTTPEVKEEPKVFLRRVLVLGGDERVSAWLDNLPPAKISHMKMGGAHKGQTYSSRDFPQAEIAFVLTPFVGHSAVKALRSRIRNVKLLGKAKSGGMREELRRHIVDFLEGRLV